MYDYSVYLNLGNWTQRRSNWTRPDDERSMRELPEFINQDGFMNFERLSFTMLWHKREVLYLVQLPVEGAVIRNDYHTIKIVNDSCDDHQYLDDRHGKKITEILSPYEQFESCFIHNDRQIICFGPNGFTRFDVDLNKTEV